MLLWCVVAQFLVFIVCLRFIAGNVLFCSLPRSRSVSLSQFHLFVSLVIGEVALFWGVKSVSYVWDTFLIFPLFQGTLNGVNKVVTLVIYFNYIYCYCYGKSIKGCANILNMRGVGKMFRGFSRMNREIGWKWIVGRVLKEKDVPAFYTFHAGQGVKAIDRNVRLSFFL